MEPETSPPPAPVPRVSFFRRKLATPLLHLLGQGQTPERIAASLAVGVALGLFPIFGTTTLLCLLAGLLLRLNHPAIQIANQLMYPLQVPLMLAFLRLGEYLALGNVVATPLGFAPASSDPWMAAARIGTAGLHAVLGWAVVAPVVGAAAYLGLLPIVRRLRR